MSAQRFWGDAGVIGLLADRGHAVAAPDRLAQPSSWADDADHVLQHAKIRADQPAVVVAGSNGCSTAARLAVRYPELVSHLLLCWPVTVEVVDLASPLAASISARSGQDVATALLSGETLRGLADAELRSLAMPVAVMPSAVDNAIHRQVTVDRLARVIPGARTVQPFPEPMSRDFDAERFVDCLLGVAESPPA